MRKLQIGVIGSMVDIKLESTLKETATKLGKEIAKNDAVLVFGFEGDFESLPSIAAEGAEESGGQTLAFTWGSNKLDSGKLNSVEITTGQQRGGGREFPFVLSCDVIIAISGGSGTLMEIAMAYQSGVPVVGIRNTGGWSNKLIDTFLDERKRLQVVGVGNAKEAVAIAIKLVKRKLTK